MPILSKATKGAILSAPHLKTETVDVPEWGDGVAVIVSEMSGLARDAYYAKHKADDKDVPISAVQADLLLVTVVDESGTQVLDESDIEALRAQGSAALDRVADAAMRINGMKPGAVEGAAKNSGAATSGASGSDSLPVSGSQ
ncbi:hypothetical protein ACFSHT_10410 [Paraburkholderia silviterrae]|uniref:Tail assembly chaperone n=1 Tax=Paraburkholderia silviterrae TaxID=2528715 RepID=A0A4R5ME34_9BURK|nr:hypothetical protein [Paraburkholderia silviterrae]TDG25362.1 hypothetical protein EYW47_05890 [Paraburkholderia silviterrae]